MARIARLIVPNYPHHVTQRGNRRQQTFFVQEDYMSYINFLTRYKFVMDETHLLAAVRYTEMNPVRAGLCDRPVDWPWSSARSHMIRGKDDLVDVKPMLDRIGNWENYSSSNGSLEYLKTIRKHTSTGRPAGHRDFLIKLENLTGRKLLKRKPGPKG